jgi:hypothetical protein
MKKSILGVLVAVVVGLGYSAYDYFTGSEKGGPCQWNSDCKGNLYGKFGTQCLDAGDGTGGFCTGTCSTVADCPAGWSCEDVDYYENEIKKGTNRVCVRPSPTAAVPGAVPAQPGVAPVAPAPAPAPAPQ